MSVYYRATKPVSKTPLTNAPAPRSVRVVGLLTNLVPYHHARWEAFAARPGMQCTLLELADSDEFSVLEVGAGGRASYFRQTLFNNTKGHEVSAADVRRMVHKHLSQLNPDVVCINGYSFSHSLAALEWSVQNSIPTILCSESNEFDADRNPVKEWLKRQIVKLCAAGLAGGRPQAHYLKRLGLPANHIFTGYDAVDNQYFQRQSEAARSNDAQLRARYKLPERYFLACARFTEKKNLQGLLRAYARYRELGRLIGVTTPWDLVLLGDGPLRETLCSMRAALGLDGSFHLPGATQYAELPVFYGLAQGFIHASTTEQWGLVVNEAMACGLPVLVSNRCGCASDLVREGHNGFTFDPGDTEQLAKLMLEMSLLPAMKRGTLGANSQRQISRFGPEAFAAGMQQAIDAALGQTRRKASLLDRVLLKLLAYR